MIIELTPEQQQSLLQMIDNAQFPGAASEFVTDLKKSLKTPKETND